MVDCQNHHHIRIHNSRCIQMVPAAAAADFGFVDCFDFDFDFDFVDCFEIERIVDFVLAVV
jgi:hypothetical protein